MDWFCVNGIEDCLAHRVIQAAVISGHAMSRRLTGDLPEAGVYRVKPGSCSNALEVIMSESKCPQGLRYQFVMLQHCELSSCIKYLDLK